MAPFCSTDISALISLLDGHSRITVVSHMNPDGDAAGSAFGLYFFLKKYLGKEDVLVVLPGRIPSNVSFLTEGEPYISASDSFEEACGRIAASDLLLCTDFNSASRTGVLEKALSESAAPKVLVDHHLNPDVAFFDLVFSETKISSASELEYWLLKEVLGRTGRDSILPLSCATALMTGMTTDSNNFANSVFPTTLAMASELLAAGVDRDRIVAELYNRFRENRVRAMSYLLDNCLEILPEGASCLIVRKAVWNRFGLEDGELEGLVNIPLSIDSVKVSVLLREDDGFFRVSVRSKKGWSANTIARECFHGGGHELASGGRLFFPSDVATPDQAMDYVVKELPGFMHGRHD